jgi:hypothetical protein
MHGPDLSWSPEITLEYQHSCDADQLALYLGAEYYPNGSWFNLFVQGYPTMGGSCIRIGCGKLEFHIRTQRAPADAFSSTLGQWEENQKLIDEHNKDRKFIKPFRWGPTVNNHAANKQ